MEIDFEAITGYQRYRLMASLVVPRPIALVTTLGEDGTVNGEEPSMLRVAQAIEHCGRR